MFEFKIEQGIESLEIYFNSHFENIDRAVETTLEYVRKKLIQVNCFDLNVVIRELLCNAVVHGNQSNPGKMISFKAVKDDDSFRLIVKDEGLGFNPDKANTRVDALVPHGMGLTIIKSLGYKLHYSENEQSVYAIKKLNNEILKN